MNEKIFNVLKKYQSRRKTLSWTDSEKLKFKEDISLIKYNKSLTNLTLLEKEELETYVITLVKF